MTVLHIPFTYFPLPCGGTEVYVAALCQELYQLGVTNAIAAPGDSNERYHWDDTPVWRFETQQPQNLAELYDAGDALAADAFDRVLDEVRPDIVHFHAHTHAVSLRCVQKCHDRGLKVVYTYHTPTATCMSGTMMRNGKTPCDGRMLVRRCSSCCLRSRNVPALLAHLLGSLPASSGAMLAEAGLQGGIWTALRTPHTMSNYHRQCNAFLRAADHIIAVCDWVKSVLLNNGVPASKISLCRQGVLASSAHVPLAARPPHQPLRLIYLGRLEPNKGVEILLKAFAAQPTLDITLDIYGIAQGETGQRYVGHLRTKAEDDKRIRFLPPVSPAEIHTTLSEYDLLLAPSQGQETGPLVVLEAFAAGIPVLGSRRGGIAELVQEDVNGWLVQADDTNAWGASLAKLATSSKLEQVKSSISAPRSMRTVAEEMLAIYQQALAA